METMKRIRTEEDYGTQAIECFTWNNQTIIGIGICLKQGNQANLQYLWVHPESRKIGVGGNILAQLENWAIETNLNPIFAIIQPNDITTKNFLIKHGFTLHNNKATKKVKQKE